MSARSRRKKRRIEYRDIELNIMPFIDVFSLLNTFLLFSAAFFSLGMFEVQLPFFSNSPETKETRPTRDLDVKISVEREKVELTTSFTLPPVDEKTDNFTLGKEDLEKLHRKLVDLRLANEDLKKLTLYCDDDVIYEDLTKVLDVVKSRYETDPVLYTKDEKTGERVPAKDTLFPQVVMGSVIL